MLFASENHGLTIDHDLSYNKPKTRAQIGKVVVFLHIAHYYAVFCQKMNVPRYIYGLRGWIAFVAFMELGTAMRCFVDGDYLKLRVYINTHLNDYSIMNRLLGLWSLLSATILMHCALCIHHFPIFLMTICSLVWSLIMYLIEAFIYETMCNHSYTVLIPVFIKGLTIILLSAAPPFIWVPGKDFGVTDEDEIINKALLKKKWNKKRIICNSTRTIRNIDQPSISYK
ncbi:hypothetical protein CHUAL_012298 [Chamberlinius hualienensis]